MQLPAETLAETTALLTIRTQSGTWALPSAAVISIEAPDLRAAEPPPNLLALLGLPSPTEHQPRASARVLVLAVRGEHVRLTTHGALSLSPAGEAELLPLPPALKGTTALVSHLGVVGGKARLFVLSPERLLHAARSAPPSIPPHDPAAR